MTIAKTTTISFLHSFSISTGSQRTRNQGVAAPSVFMAVNDTSFSSVHGFTSSVKAGSPGSRALTS